MNVGFQWFNVIVLGICAVATLIIGFLWGLLVVGIAMIIYGLALLSAIRLKARVLLFDQEKQEIAQATEQRQLQNPIPVNTVVMTQAI
jgi:hypothetical protein